MPHEILFELMCRPIKLITPPTLTHIQTTIPILTRLKIDLTTGTGRFANGLLCISSVPGTGIPTPPMNNQV